jgi:hypothetical protein
VDIFLAVNSTKRLKKKEGWLNAMD